MLPKMEIKNLNFKEKKFELLEQQMKEILDLHKKGILKKWARLLN
jgi:hypothetical protein